MCGIFGLVRALECRHPRVASEAFVALGRLAEERGRDAAGFALVSGRHEGPAGSAGRAIRQRHVELDGCTVVKAAAFSRVWRRRYLPQLDSAAIAVGHSRWATRGSPDAVANASPMVVGRLIGSHNGDVDEWQLLRDFELGRRLGGTDTEVLLGAVEQAAGADPKQIAGVLSAVVGRAALAWVDREQPDRVHLARAALSPLAIARDREGNLYWASNPRWFRVLDVKDRFGFRDVAMVREGTYLTVVGGVMPHVDVERRFQAHARPRDALAVAAVWRGFDAADMHLDQARCTHRIAPREAWGRPRAAARHRRGAPTVVSPEPRRSS